MRQPVIGFSRSKSPYKIFSKGIQVIEKRDFGHVYIKFACPITGKTLIAQASHGMVNLMALHVFETDNIRVKEYEIDCNEEEFVDLFSFICDNLGVPYGTVQILLIAIKKIAQLELKSYNKDKYFICSEFGAKACEIIGIEMPKINLDYITPSDLDVILSKAVSLGNPRIRLILGR